jgi:endoglucanase
MSRCDASILLTLAAALAAGGCSPRASAPERTVVLGRGKAASPASPAMPGVNVPAIKVDTVGYPTAWRKLAVFNVEPREVKVVDAGSGAPVLGVAPAAIRAHGRDAASGDEVWLVDFSELRTPGRYRVTGAGATSDPFVVADDPYGEAMVAGLKSFYFQRCRLALGLPHARWAGRDYVRQAPCHDHDKVGLDLLGYPAEQRWGRPEAGWHDAGNYDMYVPSTAPAAHALLLAYEAAPRLFTDKQLDIPESGNGVPDLLDEARWGLRWVLSMQEPSGAFRHREAVMASSPEAPPDRDDTTRWIAGPSTAATAKAVATLALAARIYAPHDRAFARRCEQAAHQGWAWLVDHPERVRADGKGAEQPLWDDEPGNSDVGARLLAATEMWRSFREPAALAAARALLAEPEAQPAAVLKGSWANLSGWALATLALDERTPAPLRAEAGKRLRAAAETLRATAAGDGYLCTSALEDYYWASNANLMERARLLAVVARLEPDAGWALELAREQWHWVLGRNPNGYSMVTRVGKGPDRLYHMEWGPHEPPPPGFLIGGPNAVEMGLLAPGAPAKALLWHNPKPLRSGLPAGSAWHWQQSDLWDAGFVAEGQWDNGWWAVTEPDILYSANFVLAAASVR